MVGGGCFRGVVAMGQSPVFCPQCGSALVPNDQFCPRCGTPVAHRVLPTQVPFGFGAQITSPTGLPVSGFGVRVGATLIDELIMFIPGVIAGTVIPVLGWIIVDWLYNALQESSSYQATVGKRAVGIIVVGERGQRISFGQATGRYFGKILSWMTLGLLFLMVAFSENKRGLHDIMAGTFVVGRP